MTVFSLRQLLGNADHMQNLKSQVRRKAGVFVAPAEWLGFRIFALHPQSSY